MIERGWLIPVENGSAFEREKARDSPVVIVERVGSTNFVRPCERGSLQFDMAARAVRSPGETIVR